MEGEPRRIRGGWGRYVRQKRGEGRARWARKKLFGVRATQNVWELRRKRYGKQAIYRV